MFEKPKRKISTVFLHCSASDNKADDDVSVMRKWHMSKTPPWSDVGYHYFIKKDGTIQEGRPLHKIPAAQKGYNTGSIAICLHGLKEKAFTEAQFNSLRKLCNEINAAYGGSLWFRGHKEVANKLCPVFPYAKVLGLDSAGYMQVKENVLELPQKQGVIDMEKAGYKTTEFWIALVTSLLTTLNQAGILGSIVLPVESIAAVAGVIASYVLGRSLVKLKA